MAGSGCGWDVAGQTVPGKPGEKGEGGGFLALGGEIVVVCGVDRDFLSVEQGSKAFEKEGVAGASTGGDEFCAWGEEGQAGVENSLRGKLGGGGEEVFRAALVKEAGGVVSAELLAAAGFWRLLAEVRVFQEFGEKLRDDLSAAGGSSFRVKG